MLTTNDVAKVYDTIFTLSIIQSFKSLKINYGAFPGTGQSSPKSKGINEGHVGWACVYAGSFWTLQQPWA